MKAGHREYIDSYKKKGPSETEADGQPREPTLTEELGESLLQISYPFSPRIPKLEINYLTIYLNSKEKTLEIQCLCFEQQMATCANRKP